MIKKNSKTWNRVGLTCWIPVTPPSSPFFWCMTLVASWPSLSAMHSEGCSPEKCKAVPRNQPFYHSPPTPRNFPLIGHKNQPTTALRKGLTVCYMVSESCLWLVYVTGSRLEQKTGESVSGMYFNPVEMVKLLLKSFYKVCNLGSGGGGWSHRV